MQHQPLEGRNFPVYIKMGNLFPSVGNYRKLLFAQLHRQKPTVT
jgi:hypothetical protein